jgi:transglutaminase-like putative cysteine protease
MPMLSLRHVTRYRYREPVGLGEHRMMFRPRESYDQRLLSCELAIEPTPARLHYVQDVFGNCVGVASFAGRSRELLFDSSVRLEHTPVPAFVGWDGEVEVSTGVIPLAYAPEDLPDLLQSIERQHPDPDGAVDGWARSFVRRSGKTPLRELLTNMTQAIHADFRYAKRLEKGAQTPVQTLSLKSGSCRDYAILLIDAVRSLGLAARFVSGYVYSPAAVGASGGRIGGGHTHAWARVYLPACGWVEFDPTNGIVGNAGLVRVAVSRDPRQAAPLHGTWIGRPGAYVGMDVEVDVRAEGEMISTQPSPLRAVRMAG